MIYRKIKKGLDLPIKGRPSDVVLDQTDISRVGLLGDDYPNLRPSLKVRTGDRVKKGQLLFTDRKNPSLMFTSPVAGVVAEINRGEKRRLLSVVIEKDGSEAVQFDTDVAGRAEVLELLKVSGLLTRFRRRPFATCVSADEEPEALFVNCMDTRPNAPDMNRIISRYKEYFYEGLKAAAKLAPKTYACTGNGVAIDNVEGVETAVFDGVHPAGLTGTHIHFLRPVSQGRLVWTVDAQTMIDFGYLIKHKELNEERIVALGGEFVTPCHVRTLHGASVNELVKGRLKDGDLRLINGSVLFGLPVTPETAYLSTDFAQISAVAEQTERPFMGWLLPGFHVHSVINVFASKVFGEKSINFDTSLNGSHRAMVPVGTYEKVTPMDILPTHLLRALQMKDYEGAEKLGALELSEEDLSLCTYVCPGKTDYAPLLRDALTTIEKEG